MVLFSLALAGLLSLSAAAPRPEAEIEERAASGCTKFFIPVTASAKNLKLSGIPKNIANPTILQGFITQQAEAIVGGALANGGVQTNGSFSMAAIYCKPTRDVPKRADTIQYLQHAITMRKEYWNGLTYPVGFDGEKYSYMTVARANGYHTLAVDNLGAGESSHPDPVTVTQQTLQVEAINAILQKLRQGKVGGPVANKKWSKIIYAGHSYGSICGNGVATHHPKSVDAFILTGYTAQFALGAGPLAAGLPIPAKLVHPRFASLQLGYLADSSAKGRASGLYTAPNSLGGFDAGLINYDQKFEGTGAIGELATLLYGVGPAEDYSGCVLVITGQNDAIACNVNPAKPDCGRGPTSLPAKAGAFFPNAKNYSYHIPKVTGHNANLHFTSPDSFKVAMNYLDNHGF